MTASVAAADVVAVAAVTVISPYGSHFIIIHHRRFVCPPPEKQVHKNKFMPRDRQVINCKHFRFIFYSSIFVRVRCAVARKKKDRQINKQTTRRAREKKSAGSLIDIIFMYVQWPTFEYINKETWYLGGWVGWARTGWRRKSGEQVFKQDKWSKSTNKQTKVTVYLQWSFSSRFPLDVTDNARMNSSNSIDPSYAKQDITQKEQCKHINRFFWVMWFIFIAGECLNDRPINANTDTTMDAKTIIQPIN